MDHFYFDAMVARCKQVQETSTAIEIFSYSDPEYNTTKEVPLGNDGKLNDFLNRRGAFTSKVVPDGVMMIGGIRLIAQSCATHFDTFAPNVISLKSDQYKSMVKALHLPYEGIETSTCVGPLFWWTKEDDDENPYLQLVFRRSDVRKKGFTRGFELLLSHEIKTGITAGFCKGTPGSDMIGCIEHLKASVSDIAHPMLFPAIMLLNNTSDRAEIKQREAASRLRRIEFANSSGRDLAAKEEYSRNDGVIDLDAINRDLVFCHSEVLWKPLKPYLRILKEMKQALEEFYHDLSAVRRKPLRKLQTKLMGRLDLFEKKLEGIDSYANITLSRIEIQRNYLYNAIAQKDSKLNFQMAHEQRKLAHESKRQGTSMNTLSLFATVFLPGTYIASMFSTSFFNFENASNKSYVISPDFWIFWLLTIPITFAVMGLWYFFERKRAMRYQNEDRELEDSSEKMEADILRAMQRGVDVEAQTRRKTMLFTKATPLPSN